MKRLCGLIVVAAFVAVGCNRAQEPATPPAPAAQPYGTLAQVMQAIPFPHSNIVFDTQTIDPGQKAEAADTGPGASTTAQFSGVYGGWTAIENAGVALQETANLIMVPGRVCSNGQAVPLDQEDFKKWAANLATIGAEVRKVAQAKTYNADAMLDLGGRMSDACLMCHEKYRDTPNQPKDRCMPGGAAPAAPK